MKRNTKLFVISAFCITGALLTGCGSGNNSKSTQQPLACEQLIEMEIPASAIGLPTSGGLVMDAAVIEATASVPEHCLVSGRIAPVNPLAPFILFDVALPTEWNSKALMFGGGGFNGSIPDVTGTVAQGTNDTPLARGYATFASDSGHQANILGSQDGRFWLSDEAVRNFTGEALKKTRDAATFVIQKRYAKEPAKRYFAGGSTGGREALTSIQRWPDDWDGAISWYPAWNNVAAYLAGQHISRELAKPDAYPSLAQRQLLLDAVLEACDELDGLPDGIISDQRQCNDLFNPETASVNGNPLRCPDGSKAGDHCLSDALITSLRAMESGVEFDFPLASGETGYPGSNVWGADLGIAADSTPADDLIGWYVGFLALGTAQPAMPMPPNGPYLSVLVDQWVKYWVARNFDPAFDSFTLDPIDPDPVSAERISELSAMINSGTDISAFADRGGKLLLAHGTSDVLVSSRATELYYKRLLEQMGAEDVASFVRYYEVPGFGHAVSASFNATWDSLSALEEWVEKDIAPENQVTVDTVGDPGRARPLCDYPAWPRYIEGGDPKSADAFECVEE